MLFTVETCLLLNTSKFSAVVQDSNGVSLRQNAHLLSIDISNLEYARPTASNNGKWIPLDLGLFDGTRKNERYTVGPYLDTSVCCGTLQGWISGSCKKNSQGCGRSLEYKNNQGYWKSIERTEEHCQK